MTYNVFGGMLNLAQFNSGAKSDVCDCHIVCADVGGAGQRLDQV